MDDAPDFDLAFPVNVGCVGRAWGEARQVIGDLSIPEVEGGPSWLLSPEDKAKTKNVKAILSTPVFHPEHPDEIVGIFSVDSTQHLDNTGFKSEAAGAMASGFAGALGGLLLIAQEI